MTDSNQYMLSKADWDDVRTYVADALRLPRNKEEFMAMTMLKSEDLVQTDLSDLYKVYSQNYDGCDRWKQEIFPQSLSLTADLVTFNEQVKQCYPDLHARIETYVQNPTISLREPLEQELAALVQRVQNYANRVNTVKEMIAQFAEQTAGNKTSLKELSDFHTNKLSENVKTLADLDSRIAELQGESEKLRKDIESTERGMSFVSPEASLGMARSLGRKQDKLKQTEDELADLKPKQQTAQTVKKTLEAVVPVLGAISKRAEQAALLLEKMTGAWRNLSENFEELQGILQESVQGVTPSQWNLGLEIAVDQWSAIVSVADAYKQHCDQQMEV